MIKEKIKRVLKKLESPDHPLLGPNLKILYFSLILHSDSKIQTVFSYFTCVTQVAILITQFIDVWISKEDFSQSLESLSITFLTCVCVAKMMTFVIYQTRWKQLIEAISLEEIHEIHRKDADSLELISEYTKYSRNVTYSYTIFAESINIFTIFVPLLIYISSSKEIKNGIVPLPLIYSAWFPFDTTKLPGYWIALTIQALVTFQIGLVITSFDCNAVAMMTFIKGHLKILRNKCKRIFETQHERLEYDDIIYKIKECHRHHNNLFELENMFNSLLSPLMFVYVLNFSMCLCCTVIQLTLGTAETSEKVRVMLYTAGLISQLFLYFWHANEVTDESFSVDMGIYESNWWLSDVRVRKSLILLAGKLAQPFALTAGPFTNLSVASFLQIMKGSYSFYTLVSNINED